MIEKVIRLCTVLINIVYNRFNTPSTPSKLGVLKTPIKTSKILQFKLAQFPTISPLDPSDLTLWINIYKWNA